ncbi:MAG: redox-sensing transcriptional repressor Rex [Spirochaetia bacterium]|jgi:redox-sensing transcriptional repressor|nr:redox-sensing transcriptional repressor Rex [Spirochaetia bacterium]
MNKEIILRLSKYKRLLQKLKALGLEKVFSNNLGDALGVTSALVRKDFSFLKIKGNKRGGYIIDELIEEIDSILGQHKPREIIVVGCGKIGTAIMQYNGLARDGITIAAGFDILPDKVAYKGDALILPMSELDNFVYENQIKVGVIAVPESAATAVFEKMISAGILGYLNFSPVELKCTKDSQIPLDNKSCYVINNINLAVEIENLFYHVNRKEELMAEIGDNNTK